MESYKIPAQNLLNSVEGCDVGMNGFEIVSVAYYRPSSNIEKDV